MAEVFYGRWKIEVLQNDAAFAERFVISGSLASDGAYPGVVGAAPVTVDGQGWQLRLEWNDRMTSGWQQSQVRRNDAAFSINQGLTAIVGADDNVEALRDHDFNDELLKCKCLDPEVNVSVPFTNPFDFSRPG